MSDSLRLHTVYEILQARILEWVAVPFSRRSSQPRGRICVSHVSCIGRRALYHQHYLGSLTQRLLLKKSSLPTLHIQFQSEIFRNSVNLWWFHYIIYHILPDSILFYFMPINSNFFLVWKEQADRAITIIHWTKAFRAIMNLKGRKKEKAQKPTTTHIHAFICVIKSTMHVYSVMALVPRPFTKL